MQSSSSLSRTVRRLGTVLAYASLAIVFAWFGGMKFTAYEAGAIEGLVANSPLIGWTYSLLSVSAVAAVIGSVEVLIALLLAGRLISPRLSALGALGAALTFVLTSSLLLSTPGVVEPSLGFPGLSVLPGQFLLKDLALFAVSVLLLGESLEAADARNVARTDLS